MRAPFPFLPHWWVLTATKNCHHLTCSATPPANNLLLITGREPISKNPLPSPCPFFSAGPAVWEELLQWEEAWPLPTSSLPWCTSFHVGLWERISEGYTEAPEVMTRDDRKGCLQGFFEARSAWTTFGLNFLFWSHCLSWGWVSL